jgi:hypothetical protein
VTSDSILTGVVLAVGFGVCVGLGASIGVACVLVGIGLLVLFVRCFGLSVPELQLVFHARVPLVTLAFLGTLPFLANLTPLGNLILNAFIVHNPWHLFCTTIICGMGTVICGVIYRVIEYNGIERFLNIPLDTSKEHPDPFKDTFTTTVVREGQTPDPEAVQLTGRPWKRLPDCYQQLLTVVIGLMIPLACWRHSALHETLPGRLSDVYSGTAIFLGAFFAGICVIISYCLLETLFPTQLRLQSPTGWDLRNISAQLRSFWRFLRKTILLIADFIRSRFKARLLAREPRRGSSRVCPAKGSKATSKWGLERGRWPGYASAKTSGNGSKENILHPGHSQMLVSTISLGIAYVVAFCATGESGTAQDENVKLPMVAYVVFVVMIATSVLSAMSFFLDYYRVPVLLFVAVLLLGKYHLGFGQKPITFSLRYTAATADSPDVVPSKMEDVVDRRMRRAREAQNKGHLKQGNRKPVLIIVTSPGGGIHASAWAARVLTGLTERYEKENQLFVRSLGIISGVSGGGVGNRYFVDMLARVNPEKSDFRGEDAFKQLDAARCKVNALAQSSSLDAIGWGLAFPDLVHAVNPLPWGLADLFPAIPRDRGDALDNAWDYRLKAQWSKSSDASQHKSMTLNGLAELTASGELPIIVWSATDVVTGKRVVIAPVENATGESNDHAVDLYKLVRHKSGRDIGVSTAARLAATFPYVSPIVGADVDLRNSPSRECQTLAALRLIDGGYFDNEGIVTAARWILRLQNHYREKAGEDKSFDRPFDRIVLIRIEPNPSPEAANPPRTDPWVESLMPALGPAFGLANVRVASQVDRGNLECDLFVDMTERARQDNFRSAVDSIKRSGVDKNELRVLLNKGLMKMAAETPVTNSKESPAVADLPKIAEADSKNIIQFRRLVEGLMPERDWNVSAGKSPSPDMPLFHELEEGPTDAELASPALAIGKLPEAIKALEPFVKRADEIRKEFIEVRTIRIPFCVPYPSYAIPQRAAIEPPLSWALSVRERKMYDAAWDLLVEEANAFEASQKTKGGSATTESSPARPPLAELHELLTR